MTIKQKQWQLYFLGYYGGGIDGIWGEKSIKATAAFQSDNGLDDDGVFGPLTQAKSIAVIRQIQKEAGMPPQEQDGLAGAKTVAAIKVYQSGHGLAADGIAGVLTRGKMLSQVNWDGVKNFTRGEFACKCGGSFCNGFPAEPEKALVEAAQMVRTHFGVPVSISSGVRCKRHNYNVDGVSNSRHLTGKAMDFCVAGHRASQVLPYVRSLPQIHYAYPIDENYIHMDVQ